MADLIVILKKEAGLRVSERGLASTTRANVAPLANLLRTANLTLEPLFGISEEQLLTERSTLATQGIADVPDLSIFYRISAPEADLQALAAQLQALDLVDAAYIAPPADIPYYRGRAVPRAGPPPPPTGTPDFTARQQYLDAAPVGIDARYAWTVPGGGGTGVRIIDIEGAWQLSHEDLRQQQTGLAGGIPTPDPGWRNHGTAVIGEFSGDRNTFGITGICPDANVRVIAAFEADGSFNAPRAIYQAANALNAGDIILIELHYAGPRHNFQPQPDQSGYIAVEWWEPEFNAIRYATSKGILVVEAAGNGAEDLDDPLYNTRPATFPAAWTNPFDRTNRDSGAIVVGAGNPPAGIHGRHSEPNTGEPYVDRARCGFSNYGRVIDVQGWGWEVTTAGYNDLQGGGNEDVWYTDTFSGTSSASPIVVGALGCAQGARRVHHQPLLTPATARQLLRATGSPQQAALPDRPSTQRIGNRPNLREMMPAAPNALPQQWHLPQINAPQAWHITTGDPTVVIAVIDDGVDVPFGAEAGHESFPSPAKIVPAGDHFDFEVGTNNPRPKADDDNHGTAVAGVATADGNNTLTVSGSAPNSRLMGLRLYGTTSAANDARAFEFAADHGAGVMNNSWGPPDGGGAFPLPVIVRRAIDYATDNGRNGLGCAIFFAAGNGNESISDDGYASYDRVIAVAASNDTDVRSEYSDFGPEVSICAPSNDTRPGHLEILTTDRMGPAAGYNAPNAVPPRLDPAGISTNYTSTFGGTSAASPLAAGVGALMLAINADLTWQQVKYILEATADKIDAANADPAAQYKPVGNPQEGHSDWYGYGRVNALNAVRGARSSLPDGDYIDRVQVILQRQPGTDRFVSTKVLQSFDARARRAETADRIFIRGGPDGFLRAELVALADEVEVDR